jgi:hypothetical protein
VKVLSVVGSPAAVSETVLSLARGVTPMYLTRTKLLAAGLVLVGVLTTGIGVLSKADAQAPPNKPDDEAVRKYYDALRSHEAPRSKWEYKFIPVDKPLTTADLQTVLAHADQDGWSYCGSQELAVEKTGKISPHMVFKRPRAGALTGAAAAASLAETVERERAAAALAELEAAKRAARGQNYSPFGLQGQIDEAKRRQDLMDRYGSDATRAKKLADDEAKARDAAVEARRREALLEHDRAQAEKERQDAARARDEANSRAASDKDRQKQLEAMKAQYEAMIQALQAELKAKSVPPPTKADPPKKKPEPQASDSNPFGSTAKTPGPDDPITAVVELQHIDGKTAAALLGNVLPQAKVVAEVSPNRIVLKGPAKTVIVARDLIRSKLDVPADADKGGSARPDVEIFRLKHTNASDMLKVIEKVIGSRSGVRYTSDASTNALIVTGPPAVLADVRRLVTDADKPSGPAK